MRVIFMGTPEFAVPCLKKLIELHSEVNLVGVYTQPDRAVGRGLKIKASPIKALALEISKCPIIQPQKLSLPGEFEILEALKPDLIVVVAFGQILKQQVLTLPKWGCVNVHSSLLPRWRGAAPIQAAILNGDQKTGVTTMKLVEKLDAGDILLQDETVITSEDTAGTLHDRLALMGAQLLEKTILGIKNEALQSMAQNENLVTYAPKLTKEMEKMDFQKSAAALDRQFRALYPWPGSSIWLENQRIQLKAIKAHSEINGVSGQIFEKSGMILIGAAQGSLELIRVQPEAKKEISIGDFINGLRGHGKTLPLDIS